MASDQGTPSTPAEVRGPHAEAAGASGGTRRPWTDDELSLLSGWLARVAAGQHAHYLAAGRLRRYNLFLGIPTIVLTTIVGTSLFATLSSANNRVAAWVRLTIGMISILAAVLAAIQTFLRFADRAEHHDVAADWFSAVRRDMEQVKATRSSTADPDSALTAYRKEINRIVQHAPEIGERLWHRIASDYGVKEPPDRLDRLHRGRDRRN